MMRESVGTLGKTRAIAGSSAPGCACCGFVRARFAAMFALALLVAACAYAAMPWSAYADGASEEEQNLVDPTQRADNSFIYDTTIASLSDQTTLYDNRTVQVYGEVIGDLIRAERGGGYWVMVSSTEPGDASSISALLPAAQANQVDRFGRYGVTGTTLQVRGTYHQACSEHNGLPDIHVTSSAVLAKGVDHEDRFEAGDYVHGVLALGLGFLLMGVYYYVRERTR